MMAGKQTAECAYCWNIENLGPEHYSDRHFKSCTDWAAPFLPEVLKDPLSPTISPRYVEVSFSRACNFRCSYCSAICSSSWLQDISRNGPYPGREWETSLENLDAIYLEENNPYIEAFWKWWPELKKNLHTFRITGGEPLLSPNTFKTLEKLKDDPAPNLSLCINSNLGVPRAKVELLVEYARPLLREKKIRELGLFTSLEAWGKRAEFIRSGLDFETFQGNLHYLLENLPGVPITFMVTFNALSVTSFRTMLEKLLELREKYSALHKVSSPIFIDISYLTHPAFQSVQILPEEYRPKVKALVDFLAENQAEKCQTTWGFYDWELAKMARLYDWMCKPLPQEHLDQERGNFYKYFHEYGLRRGLSFVDAFPEMEDFWETCKTLAVRADEIALHNVKLATKSDALLFGK